MLKRIVNITVWTLIGLYAFIVAVIHIPTVQSLIGNATSNALSSKLGTKVTIGRIDLGFINRLIIDDSQMLDQSGKQMLKVSRISVKISPLALAKGEIEITSAQFFGLKANLYKTTPEAKPNFQFVIDSLASKDTTKQSTPINLQISSLILRHSDIRYRCLSKAGTRKNFSVDDIDVRNISSHIIVDRITNDSLNIKVKRLSFKERCGLSVDHLSLHAVVGRTKAELPYLEIKLPNSELLVKNIEATYNIKDNTIEKKSLKYRGEILSERFALPDLACFVPKLANITGRTSLKAIFSGTAESIDIKQLAVSNDMGMKLEAEGVVNGLSSKPSWNCRLKEMQMKQQFAAMVLKTFTGKDLPKVVENIDHIALTAHSYGNIDLLHADGKLKTNLGDADFGVKKEGKKIVADVKTNGLGIGELLQNDNLGRIAANLTATATSKDDVHLKGNIASLDFNKYTYRNIRLDASYRGKTLKGVLTMNDRNADIDINALYNGASKTPNINLKAEVRRFVPSVLNISNKWGAAAFALNIDANIRGNNVNDAAGSLQISNLSMQETEDAYSLANLRIDTGFKDGEHFLDMNSDFGNVAITGSFDYQTIVRSLKNMIASKLPSMPGLEKKPTRGDNAFTINALINDTEWLNKLLGVPLYISQPISISGGMDEKNQKIDLRCDIPNFSYKDSHFSDAFVTIGSPGDTLRADISLKKLSDKGKALALRLSADAFGNRLKTSAAFRTNSRHPMHGVINASTLFAKNEEGLATAYVDVLKSEATIGDSTWHIMPASITYYKNHLDVDNFTIKHGDQHLIINGTATNDLQDSLTIALKDIDVSYILNLVNFHSVDFFGMASGNAVMAGVFSKEPQMGADLSVKQFKFETGRMGTLYANVAYDNEEGRINIDAKALDEDNRRTIINGYVSPKHKFIDLAINANRTRAEFMEGFCDSFMDNIDADIIGNLNVVGPLSNINLVGKAVVSGKAHMSAMNTTYYLKNDTVTFVPDEIKFAGDTIRDRNGNIGLLSGSIYHKHLTNLSYSLNVKAKNLLAYDTHSFDGNSFYGTAYVTGDCSIVGKSGEVTIDVEGVPEKNSILVYNVSDNSSVSSHDYIHWANHDQTDDSQDDEKDNDKRNKVDISTNIKLNFLINCNPDATLKLIMDEATGDYITLNGNGVMRASYFNKGSFDLYGNYIIDHGIYKLTIQNIIKKDFLFQKGGMISFGGDPYNASLDMKALYTLNSVSLSDLNIGKSFTNNNVRVNCLMNITGTPDAPKVDFNLDMPTLGNDVKQMVYSLLNAEEETNQQVLYLLAVGRFYSQGTNNAAGESGQQYSQTSLAMQSFLSGTVSQQINTVLSNVINSSNWNFGANISTGDEGFNNAEYEGLLSGRLLNNRLLLNGQFGYRDNPNATTSFIGDFDLRYLLFPNGNLAINVYNKTNDRYFTRNSLNTQGVGIIMRKDFTKMSDLFFWRKKKTKTK